MTRDYRQMSTQFKYQLDTLVKIGVSLSAENNLNRLLDMIVFQARQLTRADGGTLYLLADGRLRFTIIQNSTLGIHRGGESGHRIDLESVELKKDNVCAYAAILGKTVTIADVYESKEFDFSGPRKYDAITGYRSQSMLVVPMKNHLGAVTGVLQLVNAMEQGTREVTPFDEGSVALVEAMASMAAVAIEKTKLLEDTRALFNSVIEVLGVAMDAKSHYTGNHIQKVAKLNIEIAKAIHDDTEVFPDIRFTENELEEIRLAGWLHDIGKVTTPEWVMDKDTKLKVVLDRIHLIEERFTRAAEELVKAGKSADAERLMADLQFIRDKNRPVEDMRDDDIRRLREIAGRRLPVAGHETRMLSDDELRNLVIRRGSLTEEEIEKVKEHAVWTTRMLEKLSFPDHLKNVALYAVQHHEKLNGQGYPTGVGADKIPFQSRILAIADLYEALSARDRPYKERMPYEQTIGILRRQAENGDIDGKILEFLVDKDVFRRFEEKYRNGHNGHAAYE
ncbi:MAG TPA: HD domain-containing phosphohydrolase [bacterium]|nr:HD domain-containing phosphohydrolase [bacterium]